MFLWDQRVLIYYIYIIYTSRFNSVQSTVLPLYSRTLLSNYVLFYIYITIPLDFYLLTCNNIKRRLQRYPGVAQFGSALEWGSRGREFDSRHSDQKTTDFTISGLFYYVQSVSAHQKCAQMNSVAPLVASAVSNEFVTTKQVLYCRLCTEDAFYSR